MKRSTLTTAALAATLAIAGLGAGQPAGGAGGNGGGSGGQAPQPGTQAQPPSDAAAIRKLIEGRLDDHRQGIKRLEEALNKLNNGGDPVVIGRELFEQFREQRRGPGNRGAAAGDGARPGQGAGGAGGGGERQRSEYDMTGPRLSPEEHTKVLAMLREKHQPLLDKIDSLAAGNDEMRQRLIDGVGTRMRWLEAMRERDKENKEFELQAQNVSTGLDVLTLGKAITEAQKRNDQTAEKLAREKLVKVMNERFDTRQQISRLKLAQLRKQADELEKQLKKNDETRDEVVQKRTDDYLAKVKEKPEKKGEPAPAKP